MSNLESLQYHSRFRGRANVEMIPETAAKMGAAVGTYLGGKDNVVVTGRDFRADSRMIKRSFSGGLLSTGTTVMDLHASPAPIVQFAVRRFGATCGALFASSHYASDEIVIRLFNHEGIEYSEREISEISKIYGHGQFLRASPSEIGTVTVAEQAILIYRNALATFVNTSKISKSDFRVVIDCSLGPSSMIVPSLLSELRCDVIAMNSYIPTAVPEALPTTE